MTLLEAIKARHSVRAYKNQPLAEEAVRALQKQIAILNSEGGLHIQLILDEPKAFSGTLAKYGKFRGVCNYLVMAGKKSEDLYERVLFRRAARAAGADTRDEHLLGGSELLESGGNVCA